MAVGYPLWIVSAARGRALFSRACGRNDEPARQSWLCPLGRRLRASAGTRAIRTRSTHGRRRHISQPVVVFLAHCGPGIRLATTSDCLVPVCLVATIRFCKPKMAVGLVGSIYRCRSASSRYVEPTCGCPLYYADKTLLCCVIHDSCLMFWFWTFVDWRTFRSINA